MKKKEITNVSISSTDGKEDLELPSLTFCPYSEMMMSPFSEMINKQENMTFEEYMEHVQNVSDFFLFAMQYDILPSGR